MSGETTDNANAVIALPGPAEGSVATEPVPAPAASSEPVAVPVESAQTAVERDDDVVAEPTISQETEIPGVFAATALIGLDALTDDDTFRIRSERDTDEQLSRLATDLARLGQLFPVDVRPVGAGRFQLITGFRRVAALRFLKRDKVSARLHVDLSDADALLMALASAIHGRAVTTETLSAWQQRLTHEGRLTPPVRDMLEKALAADDELSPEETEEEVDADELAADVTARLGQANQDLSLLADVFAELSPESRQELLTQLRYSVDLVRFLESKS